MKIAEAINLQRKSEIETRKKQMELFKMISTKLPSELLGYDWDKVNYSPYPTGWSLLSLYLKKDDPATTAVITGWLTSLFDDIKIAKPQWSRYSNSAYIESDVKIGENELKIYIYCYKTGECKKVKIRKEVPEEITEAHVEEEYAIICAGEELPEGAELVEV